VYCEARRVGQYSELKDCATEDLSGFTGGPGSARECRSISSMKPLFLVGNSIDLVLYLCGRDGEGEIVCFWVETVWMYER